jgi:hypothetical protein
MANKKKNFTLADGAVDKFFTQHNYGINHVHDANNEHDTTITEDTKHTNITKHTKHTHDYNDTNVAHVSIVSKVKHKSKHYDDRGKRDVRIGLLLDEKLKKDLKDLAMANGNKSVNDFIVTILLDHIESEESQAKLLQYRKMLD